MLHKHLLGSFIARCVLQTWCRGKKTWESELLCLDCHHFSWRSYKDPDFKTPEEYERDRWDAIIAGQDIAIVQTWQ